MLKEMVKEDSYVPVIKNNHFSDALVNIAYLNIPKDELYRISNWFKYNGSFYYVKYIDTLNEFIGERLAESLKLRTAHYIPVKLDNNILVASRNFKYMDYKYLGIEELSQTVDIPELFSNIKYQKIREDILKMFSIDIYMRQTDRSLPNILFEYDTENNLALAPVYDYDFSFFVKHQYKYENPFFDIEMKKEEFKKIIDMYPELYENLSKLMEIDINKILSNVCDEFNLFLLKEIKEYYIDQNEISIKMLNKVM